MKLEEENENICGTSRAAHNQRLRPTEKKGSLQLSWEVMGQSKQLTHTHTHVCTRTSKAECFQSVQVLRFSAANHVLCGA